MGSNQPAPSENVRSTTLGEANFGERVNLANTSPISPLNLYVYDDQGLKESVCREVVIASGDWTSSDPVIGDLTDVNVGDVLFKQPRLATVDIPSAIFAASTFITNKMSNIAYFKSDVEVTLRVQATPFTQGVLMLWNHPYENPIPLDFSHYNEHLRSITSFPHVLLSLEDESRISSIVVPFTSELQVLNHRANQDFSKVSLSVLSAFDSASTADFASWSITAKFLNPTFYGMSPEATSIGVSNLIRTEAPYVNGQLLCHESVGTQTSEDESASKRGLISNPARVVADVAGALGNIPLFASVLKPISWAARAVQFVASFFGFSRPTDLEKLTVVSNIPARGYTNLTGIDQSQPLAALPDNSVRPTSYSPLDEMSIEYIAQRPYLLGRAQWNSSDPDKTVLGSFPVHPSPTSILTSAIDGVFQGAPSSLTSRLFKWWRGNMVVRFVFAKTRFHQGRLLVQYMPFGVDTIQPLETVYSQIIDISQITSEGVEIEIPSLMNNKWYSVSDANPNGAWAGVVVVSVLNQLRATDTVAPHVGILPFIHWKNFEVAEPGSTVHVGPPSIVPPTPPSGSYPPLETLTRFVEGNSSTHDNPNNNFDNGAHAEFVLYRQGYTYSGGECLQTIKDYYGAEYVSLKVGATLGIELIPWKMKGRFNIGTNNALNGATYSVTSTSVPFSNLLESRSFPSLLGEYKIEADGPYMIAGIKSEPFVGKVTLQMSQSDNANYNMYYDLDVDDISCRFTPINTLIPSYVKLQVGGVDDNTRAYELYIVTYSSVSLTVTPVTPVSLLKSELSSLASIDEEEDLSLVCHSGVAQDFSHSGTDDLSRLETTMGESVISLRALSRRATSAALISGDFTVKPHGNVELYTEVYQPVCDIIASMYRFYCGSWRYKFISTSPSLVCVDGRPSSVVRQHRFSYASHVQDAALNPIVEVSKPFYSPAEKLAFGSSTFDISNVHFTTLNDTPLSGVLLKAAGDDNSYTFLVGAPVFTM